MNPVRTKRLIVICFQPTGTACDVKMLPGLVNMSRELAAALVVPTAEKPLPLPECRPGKRAHVTPINRPISFQDNCIYNARLSNLSCHLLSFDPTGFVTNTKKLISPYCSASRELSSATRLSGCDLPVWAA